MRPRVSMRIGALLVSVLALAACEPREATEIMLEIRADEEVRDGMSALRVRVLGGTQSDERATSFDETQVASELEWPVELGIVPQGGDTSRTFAVEVSALDDAQRAIVVARVESSFVPGETRLLRLSLEAACLDVACSDETTCVDGACRATPEVDPSTLPRVGEEDDIDASLPELDGGLPVAPDASDDLDASVLPDATEPMPDSGPPCTQHTFYVDADEDGFGDPTMPMVACEQPAGTVSDARDCNDACSTCRPGGAEVCGNDLDEDCEGTLDNGCACRTGETRACGTEEGVCRAGTQRCTGGEWGSCEGEVLGTTESCNRLDDDCDGTVDGSAADASCVVGPNVTGAACRTGACSLTCATGYADCGSSAGCETDTRRDANHCGMCGRVCSSGMCSNGTCVASPIDEIVAGSSHTCARRGGRVLCWGSNQYGQLGDGTTTDRLTPVAVAGITDAAQLSAGSGFTCVRRANREILCWGLNSYGQLGDGTTTNRTTPARAGMIDDAVQLMSGTSFSCVRHPDETVSCWGRNTYYELGDGTDTHRSSPVRVMGVTGVVDIDTGSTHSCARHRTGAMTCWGSGGSGQLGNGITGRVITQPVAVVGVTNAIEMFCGATHSCAVLATGAVQCWGGNSSGQLGDGTTTERTAPTTVAGLSNIVEVEGADNTTCARSSAGRIWCWGSNFFGAVGDGTTTNRTDPTPIDEVVDAAQLAGGNAHACVRRESGGAQCWGLNANGRLGDGTTTQRNAPVTVMLP